MLVSVSRAAPAGGNQLLVNADPRDLPTEGIAEVLGHTVTFTRRRSSPILNIRDEFGLPVLVPAGTVVLLVEATPTPGPSSHEVRGESEGCSMSAYPAPNRAALLLLIGAAGLAVLSRRRR
jgi:MYXO-CTERM domain-containing protein